MTYWVPLPEGGARSRLDIVEPNSTAVQRFLRREGLANYEPPTVAALLALFEQQDPGFAFFDVGANMGLYALLCASLFEPGAVDAFEPTPSTAAVLRKAVRANRLDIGVVEAAAGDAAGKATLHLSDKSDASNSLVAGFKASSSGITVETIRLDDHVAATGHAPAVMKIDVETFEPAVLAGAVDTIERHRPYIVLEVLNRRGHDHGVEITEAMAGYGYSFYELSQTPSWEPSDVVRGIPKSGHLDWLLAPTPLESDFADRFDRWADRLSACTADRNSSVPLWLSVKAAMSRGGVREVVASGRRYVAAIRRGRTST